MIYGIPQGYIIPNQLKIEKFTPVYKSGTRSLFNNYEPISILPAYSKLLEKLVCVRLLNRHDIPYKYQLDFEITTSNNNIHPIIHLLNHIADSSDKTTKDTTIVTV